MARSPFTVSPPESVLIYVGLDLLGDGLMKLPFVRAVRAAFPKARVTWLAGKGKSVYAGRLASLVDGLIDEVIEDAGIGSKSSEFLSPALPGRSFDLILDTQRRVLTTVLVRRIRHGVFISSAADFALSNIRPVKGLRGLIGAGYKKPPAMIDQMLNLVALARDGELGGELVPETPLALPGEVLDEAERLLPGPGPYVALSPGAGGRHKCWSLNRFGALAARASNAGLRPVFILGPDEGDWLEPLRAAAPEALFPLSDVGARLDLEPLLTIALARQCAACVANDSGVGHLLAQADVPQVSLFGPTPPDKFAPRTRRLTVIRAQDFDGEEMDAIPLDAVYEAVGVAMAGSGHVLTETQRGFVKT